MLLLLRQRQPPVIVESFSLHFRCNAFAVLTIVILNKNPTTTTTTTISVKISQQRFLVFNYLSFATLQQTNKQHAIVVAVVIVLLAICCCFLKLKALMSVGLSLLYFIAFKENHTKKVLNDTHIKIILFVCLHKMLIFIYLFV